MKAKPMFRVVGVRPDSEPFLILQQSTRHGAELVLRLIQNASPFSEVRIEGGPPQVLTPDDRSEGTIGIGGVNDDSTRLRLAAIRQD
jgi:hypothetical protein